MSARRPNTAALLRDPRGFLRGWRAFAFLFALALLIAIGLGLRVALKREEIPGIVPPERTDLGGRSVEVLFPSEEGEWVSERREILASASREIEIRRLVDELLRGPRGKASPVFPEDTRLEDVFWDGDGELTLGFSEHLRSDHPGGSRAETATIHALLGTVKLAYPDVQRVRFLIEGEIVSTIAGHVDVSEPLEAFVPR